MWRCRARLPNVLGSFLKFDDWSYVGCRLSPRDRAIITEVNETAFSVNFLETGGIGCSESCEKVVCHLGYNDYRVHGCGFFELIKCVIIFRFFLRIVFRIN